jgi:hypothetical protein
MPLIRDKLVVAHLPHPKNNQVKLVLSPQAPTPHCRLAKTCENLLVVKADSLHLYLLIIEKKFFQELR